MFALMKMEDRLNWPGDQDFMLLIQELIKDKLEPLVLDDFIVCVVFGRYARFEMLMKAFWWCWSQRVALISTFFNRYITFFVCGGGAQCEYWMLAGSVSMNVNSSVVLPDQFLD